MSGDFELGGWRYMQGLVAAAVTGGALTGGYYFITALGTPWTAVAGPVVIVATIVWAAGIILVGTPCWAMLAAMGRQSRPVALWVGGGLCALIGGGFGANVGATAAMSQALLFGLAGLIVAWVGWSVAYRQPHSID